MQASIDLSVEFEVVDENSDPIEPESSKWEEAQDACIEAIMGRIYAAVAGLEFDVSVREG